MAGKKLSPLEWKLITLLGAEETPLLAINICLQSHGFKPRTEKAVETCLNKVRTNYDEEGERFRPIQDRILPQLLFLDPDRKPSMAIKRFILSCQNLTPEEISIATDLHVRTVCKVLDSVRPSGYQERRGLS